MSLVVAMLAGCDDIGTRVLASIFSSLKVFSGAAQIRIAGAFNFAARKLEWRSQPHLDAAVEALAVLAVKGSISKGLNMTWHGGLRGSETPRAYESRFSGTGARAAGELVANDSAGLTSQPDAQ